MTSQLRVAGPVCRLVCRTAKLNSKPSLGHLQQLIRDQTQTNTQIEHTDGGTCIKSSRSVYAPHFVQSVRLHLFKSRGGDNAHWISKSKMAATAVQRGRFSVKISWICEFRVIMGIMTGLRECCSSSTLGSRANDYVKTLATLGFWLHHSPCSLGCWTNNTLAARSLCLKQLAGEQRH